MRRFNQFRSIDARYPVDVTTCGHPITAGQRVGYSMALRTRGRIYSPAEIVCAACWARWVAENEEAAAMERYS